MQLTWDQLGWSPSWKWTFVGKNQPRNQLAVCQNLVPLVNIKIAGKWMFIPLKIVSIGIDPYPINMVFPTVFPTVFRSQHRARALLSASVDSLAWVALGRPGRRTSSWIPTRKTKIQKYQKQLLNG
jgi:hypothetical protein